MTHPNNSAYQQYAKLCVEAKENENKSELILNCEAMTFCKTNIKKSKDQQIGLLKESWGKVILNPETAVVDDHNVPPLPALPVIEEQPNPNKIVYKVL